MGVMDDNSEYNSENVFLNLIATEQDILYKIISELSNETIDALGHTCKKCRKIYLQFGVWNRLVFQGGDDSEVMFYHRMLHEWKKNNGLGDGYDFSKRMGSTEDDTILQRLKLMKQRY